MGAVMTILVRRDGQVFRLEVLESLRAPTTTWPGNLWPRPGPARLALQDGALSICVILRRIAVLDKTLWSCSHRAPRSRARTFGRATCLGRAHARTAPALLDDIPASRAR